jgi:signal transduction histidine kinase
MLPETGTSAAVRDALEAVANDLGASTFQGPPDELMVLFGRRFADTGRANLLVVDVSEQRPDVVEAARLAQAFGTSPLVLIDRAVDGAAASPALAGLSCVEYERSTLGLRRLQAAFRTLLRQRRPPPRRWRPASDGTRRGETYQFDQLPAHRLDLLIQDMLRVLGYRRLRHSSTLPLVELLAEPPYIQGRGPTSESLCLIASQPSNRPGALRRIVQRDLPALSVALQRIRRAPAPPPEFLPFPSRLTVVLFLPSLSSADDPTQAESMGDVQLRFEELSELLGTPITLELYDRRRLLAILRSNPQIAARYFDLTTGASVRGEEYLQDLRAGSREARLPDASVNAILEQLNHERELRIEAEREAAWKDVAFTAAHKLGNPLFAIETNLHELVDLTESTDPMVRDIIQDISTSVEKAKVIIEHFKSLTKFRRISPRPTDIVPLIRSSCAPARAMGIKTRVSAPRQPVLLLVDPSLITHCLDELIGNAYHFFDKPTRRMSVTLMAPAIVPEELFAQLQGGAYARLRVSDNGRGVPKSLKDSIFTPFFSTRGGGSGFGLSMIRSVVEGHGGAVREVGREKRGATFEMYLPIAEAGEGAGVLSVEAVGDLLDDLAGAAGAGADESFFEARGEVLGATLPAAVLGDDADASDALEQLDALDVLDDVVDDGVLADA